MLNLGRLPWALSTVLHRFMESKCFLLRFARLARVRADFLGVRLREKYTSTLTSPAIQFVLSWTCRRYFLNTASYSLPMARLPFSLAKAGPRNRPSWSATDTNFSIYHIVCNPDMDSFPTLIVWQLTPPYPLKFPNVVSSSSWFISGEYVASVAKASPWALSEYHLNLSVSVQTP